MIYGYTRVSSKKQLDGYGLDVQKTEILSKYPTAIIYEEQYTGTKVDRPVFTNVFNNLKEGDVLVVARLDRFARNTTEGIKIVENLFYIKHFHIKNLSFFTPIQRN